MFLNNMPIILDYAYGDVTGDKIPDYVFLTGIKTADSPFIQNITLNIQDGKTGKLQKIALKENAGYSPTLMLTKITTNKAFDILININSGGSGAFIYSFVYSYLNNIPRLIFDSDKFNEQYKYSVNFEDFYKVSVVSLKNNLKYLIDISQKDKEYLNEIYDKDGKLKNPIQGFVNPLSANFPVDFEGDKINELLIYQKVAGRYNADSLGYVQTALKWNGKGFDIFNQFLGIFGYENI